MSVVNMTMGGKEYHVKCGLEKVEDRKAVDRIRGMSARNLSECTGMNIEEALKAKIRMGYPRENNKVTFIVKHEWGKAYAFGCIMELGGEDERG